MITRNIGIGDKMMRLLKYLYLGFVCFEVCCRKEGGFVTKMGGIDYKQEIYAIMLDLAFLYCYEINVVHYCTPYVRRNA